MLILIPKSQNKMPCVRHLDYTSTMIALIDKESMTKDAHRSARSFLKSIVLVCVLEEELIKLFSKWVESKGKKIKTYNG